MGRLNRTDPALSTGKTGARSVGSGVRCRLEAHEAHRDGPVARRRLDPHRPERVLENAATEPDGNRPAIVVAHAAALPASRGAGGDLTVDAARERRMVSGGSGGR